MLDLLQCRYGVEYGNGRRWVTAEHVKNAPGFFHTRCADLIAVDCWPAKGLEIHGHEVKVSRSDWLAELKQPEKAAAFIRHCDRWWVVVPDAALVKPGELPADWGLMSIGGGGGLRVVTAAPKLVPEPLPRELWVTLLRSAAKTARRAS
jgi:hypothetical protein